MGRVDPEEERRVERLDEFSEGYPGMRLGALLDVVSAFLHGVERGEGSPRLRSVEFRDRADGVMRRVRGVRTDSAVSWRALMARLLRLMRLGVFDQLKAGHINRGVGPMDYEGMVRRRERCPSWICRIWRGRMLRNLVIADVIRGVEEAQERAFEGAARAGTGLPRTLVVIEEAHEFLSAERARRMRNLFETVSGIAKRGRKRWLGLVFVTQHPQHLPDELLGLMNNYVLHRLNDANTIGRLRRSIGGIEAGLWDRVTSLAPGQAVVSFTHLARAMLVTVDPTQCRLRMAEE